MDNRFEPSRLLKKYEKISSSKTYSQKYFKNLCPQLYMLLNNVFDDDALLQYYLNHLAYILQTRKKPHTSFIISTQPGSGKDTIYRVILEPLFNKKHCASLSVSEIVTPFNGNDFDRWCVVYNETDSEQFFTEKKYVGMLNTMITDEQHKIRDLYKSPIWIKDYRFFTVFSNSEKPLPIADKDRRFYIARNREVSNFIDLINKQGYKTWEDWASYVLENETPKLAEYLFSIKPNTDWVTKAVLTKEKALLEESQKASLLQLSECLTIGDPTNYDKWDMLEWSYESGNTTPEQHCTREMEEENRIPGKFVPIFLKIEKIHWNKWKEYFFKIKTKYGNYWYPKQLHKKIMESK